MAKYDDKSQKKVEEVMHEMKEGKLKSGSGKKVTNPKQAIAIGLSEARKEGAKAPKKTEAKTTGQRGSAKGKKSETKKKTTKTK
ncbi:MAG TPA: DUF6496 domain-containing protein [Cytophagaceae bacterium]